MMGWHHRLDGCEFEQTLGESEGQGRSMLKKLEELLHATVHGVTESDTT